MVRRMQGVPAHITYLKKKDEGGHRSRCAYFKRRDLCKTDILNAKISIESPLGKSVLGKKGDLVEIFTDKKRIYRITNDNVK